MAWSAKGTKENSGKNAAQKRGLNKSVLNQGCGILATILSYMLVGVVIRVGPAYTSQTCSMCLHISKDSRLRRLFRCVLCGFTHHDCPEAISISTHRGVLIDIITCSDLQTLLKPNPSNDLMAKGYYVKFEVPDDLVNPIYEALRISSSSGKVKKGTNEVTKAIERNTAKMVIIAEDVDPPEVVAHLPILCDEQKIPFAFVPSQQEMGKSLGLETRSAATAIMDSGDAKHIVDQIIESLAAMRGANK